MGVCIKCENCGKTEELNARFILKIIGGTVTGFGAWAWITYLFAGTGLALPICIALVTGGSAILAFSEQIGQWVSKKYDCPVCGKRKWKVVED